MLGYSIKVFYENREVHWKYYLVGSLLLLTMTTMMTHFMVKSQSFEQPFYLLSSLSPTVMLSAILLFIVFLKMPPISFNVSSLASHTFNIYLLHAGILDLIDLCVRTYINPVPNPIWYMPLLVVVIFLVSYGCSIALNSLLKIKEVLKVNIIKKVY